MINQPSVVQPEPPAEHSSTAIEDLVIRFTRQIYYKDEGTYHARVTQSPFPIQGGDFRADTGAQLEQFQKLFEDQLWAGRFYPYEEVPTAGDPLLDFSRQELSRLGEALSDLLPVSLRNELLRLFQVVYIQGKSLRLILEAQAGDKADQLLHLPWELLFFVSTGLFPARTPRFMVVRRLLGAPLFSPAALEQPLNLNHVISYGENALSIEIDLEQMEREVLPQVIASGHYSLVADPGSIEGLRQAQAQQPATILHFLGHGVAASPYSGSPPMPSYLIFTSADGKPQYVTGQQLRQIIGEASKLQMIVLASCDTGTAGASNIAHDLVLGGFPYVVAMQSKMPQPALYHFIRRFYRELQNGQPPEYAVAAGRSEIAANLPGSIDWCLPVLYTSAGVAERSWLPHVIEQVNKVFSRTFFARMWIITGGIGILHLMVGLLLWISGVTLSSPDGRSLLQSMGWLALAPPLLAALFFRYGKLPLAADRPHQTRLALWLRLWAAVSIGLGIAAIYGIHFSVALLAGLGFWALLSPVAQWIMILPLQLVSLLFGLAQANSHGLGFITSDHVRSIPLDGSDTVLIVAGYLMLLGPPLSFLLFPDLLAPPWLNFLVGILNVGISLLLYRQGET